MAILLRLAAVLALLVLIPVGCVALRIATYEQVDDDEHLRAKRVYLERIATSAPAAERPNVVVILFDDLGYGDLGAYGARSIATPNIDSLARDGVKLSTYYAPSSVCSPSRAGLLTGRYAPRAGVPHVLFPEGHFLMHAIQWGGGKVRIPADEILLPEVLGAVGYRTGMVGKWHMGDHSPSLPNDLGFERYFGALYSNDMEPFALYRDREIAVEAPADQAAMNAHYTDAAVGFIEDSAGAPFFLYYAHSFPHIPLFSSPEQAGMSSGGLYGDVVEDLDRSVGAVLAALEREGVADETLVVVTSDNGPWYEGSAGHLRGRKNQSWDGGFRVPFLARWPGRIPPGSSVETPVMGIDLFPTILARLGLPLPDDRATDGIDVMSALVGSPTAAQLERELFFFSGETLDAVRDARFKYFRRRGVRASGLGDTFAFYTPQGPWLFDTSLDDQEAYDVSARRPEAMARLAASFAAKREEMETNLRGWR